jgi:hypothetical protein
VEKRNSEWHMGGVCTSPSAKEETPCSCQRDQ